MAKKATAKKVEVAPQEIETPQYVEPTPQKVAKAPKWEIKDRVYLLQDRHKPLTYTLQSKHHHRSSLLWFDQETGMQRELRYACLLYTSPSPRDRTRSRMPSSA